MNAPRARQVAALLASFCLVLLLATPAQATRQVLSPPPQRPECQSHKQLTDWHNLQAITNRGINFDIIGDHASADFGRTLKLNLGSNPASSTYTASRITDIDTGYPIAQRVKCWQATAYQDVVVEYRIRFGQAAPPPGLTENLMLWNSPLPNKAIPEPPIPATAIGVSRNSINAQVRPEYQMVIAQDVPLGPSPQPFIRQTAPMPSWLDASDWHTVKITLSQHAASVEVAQAGQSFVLQTALLHPPEPLGFMLSTDNEMFPGVFVPVMVPDSIEVAYIDLALVPVVGQ